MNFSKFAKLLCLIFALMFAFASTALAVNTTDFVDFPDDWSTPAMKYAVDNGLIKGYEDGTIRASQNITRAEMAAIVNRAFGSFIEAVKFPYLDVDDFDWYYSNMKKAVNMGTMQGSDNLLRPEDAITREEAFVVIARAYSQKDTDSSVLGQYPDNGDINNWSKNYLSFLTRNDYVNGFDDGNLYPQANLTRAELSQLIFNMIAEYVNSQSALDTKDTYDGNIVINGGIAEINGKTFKGDLVIGDGVGVNKIIIKDTKVEGALVVRGTTQIKIVNSTVGNRIIVNNPNNNVHFDNYRSENVFKNVEVQTSATWKTSTGGGGGGTVSYYAVNYYVNGNLWATENIPSGGLATNKTYYDKQGYTLGAWYTTSGYAQEYNFATPVTSTLNLYAKATANTYTITFGPGGATRDVTYDSTYGTLPVPDEKPGYTFDGWYIGTEKITEDTIVKITEDTTLTPKWTPNKYDLFFNENGGSTASDIVVTYDAQLATLPQPTKTGYTFAGWEIDGNAINPETVWKYTTDKTADAKWTPNTYKLTFEGLTDEITVTYDDKYPALPDAPTVAGKNFVKWETEDGTEIKEGNDVLITKNERLVAVWTDKAVWTITYNLNGGTGKAAESVIDGEKANGQTPTKTGHTFDGWYTDSGFTSAFDFNTVITGNITLHAKWNAITYEVKFLNYDGSELEKHTVAHGTTVVYGGATPTKPADNTYTYTFAGWDKSLVNITENTTITAEFTETYIDYIVKFIAEGTTVQTFTKHYNEIINKASFPAVPVKTGYEGAWNVTSDITVTDSIDVLAIYKAKTFVLTFEGLTETREATYDDKYPALPEGPQVSGKTFVGWFYDNVQIKKGNTVAITENKHLTPKYTDKNIYKVTFDANGGTPDSTQDVIDGETATMPAEPTRVGHTFLGWYKDSAGTQAFDFATAITTDTTIYAKWKIKEYTVTFKNYDGSVLDTQTVNHGSGATYTGATPTKPSDVQYNYTFTGWDEDITNITQNIEATAQFDSIVRQYTYKFFDEDGTTVLKEATVDYGTVIEKPANPTKTATAQYTYTFDKWEGYTDGMTVTGDVSFKAVYTQATRTYTVTFKNHDGSLLDTQTVAYGSAAAYAGVTPTKDSTAQYTYTFKGWDKDITNITGNLEVFAEFDEVIRQYKYTFYDEDGTTVIKEATADYGTAIVKPADPTKPATAQYTYTFDKWEGYTDGMTVSGDVTFKAVYTATLNSYNVTFVAEGTEVAKYTKYYGETVKTTEFPAVPAKTGHTGAWNVTTDITVGGNVEVSAVYTPNTYYVQYEANTGVGSMSTSEHKYDIGSNLSANAFTKTGYTFKGWAKDAAATTAEFADKEVVSTLTEENGATIILYAVWEANTYTIKYNGNGATGGSTATSTHKYDETVTLTKNGFEKTGYTFNGWDTSAEGKNVVYEDEKTGLSNLTAEPNGVINLYAVWTPITYKVRFVDEKNPAANPAYEQTFTYDVEAKLTTAHNFAIEGWYIEKWTDSAGNEYELEAEVKNLASMQDAVVELKANWMPISYTVVYEGNGADATSTPVPESQHKFDEPKALNDNTFTKEGYTFLGWRIRIVENPTTYSMRRLLLSSGSTEVQFTDQQSVENLTAINGARVILEAIWEANKYFVEYDKNNADATGTMANSQHYYDETSSLSTNKYALTGYTFDGWSTSTTGSAEYTDGEDILNLTAVKDDIFKLYAVWSENSYTVKFDGNGATSGDMTEMSFKYSEEKNLSKNTFVKTGYEFLGWSTDKNAAAKQFDDQENVSKLTDKNNGEVTLYAIWKAKTFKLTFDVDGGKDLALTTELEAAGYYMDGGKLAVNVTYDSAYPILPTAEYKDETMYFVGWKVNGVEIGKGGKVAITENSTAVAQWTDELVHTVVFNKYNEDGTAYNTTVINKTAITEPADPVKAGHTFKFWSLTEGGSEYDFATIIESTTAQTINLYPVWEANTYVLSFDAVTETVNVTYDKAIGTLPTATKTGYTFSGWYVDGVKIETTTKYTYTENKTAEAKWTANEYTIFLDEKGGSAVADLVVTFDEEIGTLPTTTKTGYTFDGWYIGADKLEETTVVDVAENQTAVAKWTANKYTLTFEGLTDTREVTYDDKYPELPVPTNSDISKKFVRWETKTGEEIKEGSNVLITSDEELVAIWTDKAVWTLTYQLNGGTGKTSETVIDGEKAKGQTPTKTGYTFNSWYADSNFTTQFDFNQPITADTSAYAKWTPNTYTLSFDADGGSAVESKSVVFDTAIGALESTSKEGYTFKGWTIDGVAIDETTGYTYAENKTAKAVWEANTYTLSFNSKGGSAVADITVTYDSAYGTLETPTMNGYTFDGWYIGAEKLESTTIVKLLADATAEAKWTPNTYTLSFDADGGSAVASKSVTFDTAIGALESTSKEGYTFKGWTVDSVAIDETTVYTYAENKTAKAVWEANTYTLSFNSKGGSAVADKTVTYDSVYGTLETPTMNGYTFDGWYIGAEKLESTTIVKLLADATAEAKWTPNTYTLSFDADGGSAVASKSVVFDTAIGALESTSKEGYTFKGWTVDSVAIDETTVYTYAENKTAKATWQANTYTVKYDGNGATSGSTAESSHTYDEYKNLTMNGFAREGFAFAGWATEKDGDAVYANGAEVFNLTSVKDGEVTLYAAWTENKYNVVFDKNGATSGSMAPMSFKYTEEKALNENQFEKTGHKFLGWAISANGAVQFADKEVVSKLTAVNNGVVKLFAVWQAETYTLTFEGLTETKEVTYGGVYPKLPVPANSDPIKNFVRWETEDGIEIAEGNVVEITKDEKLVAVWSDKNTWTVTYELNGGSGTTTETVIEGEKATYSEPSRDGYTFTGWFADEQLTTEFDFNTKIYANTTVYAKWSANTYTVKYDANGGTGSTATSTHTYDVAQNLTVNGFTREGYTFLGWSESSSATTETYENAESVMNLATEGEITLYAVWEANTYTVKYDANGGVGTTESSTHTYDVAQNLTVNGFTREGYTFLGWSADPLAENETYSDGQSVTNLTTADEITLYAIWKADAFKLTFNVNGGKELDISTLPAGYYTDTETGKITVDVVYGGQYPQLPAVEFADNTMTFGGWYLGTTPIVEGDTVKILENTELTASWTNKHIVIFHNYYNDNGVFESLVEYIEDGTAIVRPADPAEEGYTFAGWYTDEACTDGYEYDFSTIINKVGEEYQTINLYPKWLITVSFYYGPEAIESEKVGEIALAYNSLIPEGEIPASRVMTGYWKDSTVSDVYIGEEYEHKIEFLWYEAYGDDFVLFDMAQPVTESKNVFNLSKYASVSVDTSIGLIDGASISAYYSTEEPLYESILDVIFLNQNLAGSLYDKIEQKEAVFNKLIEKGIIDENHNILNQAVFLKFAITGEEYLEKFVYENVENELAVDAKESILSYLNHLVEKNDGSAEEFMKTVIDTLLGSEDSAEMKSVIGDMIKSLVENEKDEFVSYVNKYIDDSLAENNTSAVESLIKPQIERLITAQLAKDFVRDMSKDQLKSFIEIYIDTLSDDEIKAEVRAYIDGLSDEDIEKEVVEYVNSLEEDEIKAEITTYIDGLGADELKNELLSYVDELEDDELADAIVEYIETISDEELKKEIKTYITGLTINQQKEKIKEYFGELNAGEIKSEITTYINDLADEAKKNEIINYINGLDDDAKKAEIETYIKGLGDGDKATEITSYVEGMSDPDFEKEIKTYISGLGDTDFRTEVKKYLENNGTEYERLIREYLGLADDVDITEQDKTDYLDEVAGYVAGDDDRKADAVAKAAQYITTDKRDAYEAEIIEKVTTNFDSYLASIVDKAFSSDLDGYISSAVDKILVGTNLTTYVDNVVAKITASEDSTNTYINKTVDYIASDEDRLDSYTDKAIGVIVGNETKKVQYIADTSYAIATGTNRDTYVVKAVNTIIADPVLKAEYINKAAASIVEGDDDDKATYIAKAVKKILAGSERDTYINNTIDKIFEDDKEQTYIDKVVSEIVDKTPADYSEIDESIDEMFTDATKKAKVVDYINDQFITNADFRNSALPKAIDMILADEQAKEETINEIVDFVLEDEDALDEAVDVAIEKVVDDYDFREETVEEVAVYLEDHPDVMDDVLEFAKESSLGVFVEDFIDELINKDQFKVNPDNLFVAESIHRALARYDYDTFMDTYIPGKLAGLIPDSVLKPIYDDALGGFQLQLETAIEEAKLGNTAYVDSGVTVKFNPVADIIVPVFNKYLEIKGKAEDKLEGVDGTVGTIYDYIYADNKYAVALVDMIAIESLLNGDASLATETHSGYSLKSFDEYYEITRNAATLLTDAGKWYVDNLPQDKAEAAQEKLAQKVTEYYNSLLALVNTYSDTKELPSYKDVLEIFEGDIPGRFYGKYESALAKVEGRVDIDGKIETVYNKLAEKGIVSKFNTVLDRFVASKFNRELTEEQVPMVYTIVRRLLGYDNFYTLDHGFVILDKLPERFKVDEDKFVFDSSKLTITIEREYK